MNNRQLFLNHVAQTSPEPLYLEPSHAEGVYVYDTEGKKYLDLISGISVSNIGHSHPKVVQAVKEQAEKYMHVMVYGEFVLTPQIALAKKITSLLPENLNTVYFTNSGTEATEGALKMSKRYTGRTEIIYFHNAYHGSTMGALSVMGDEYFKSNFRPLVPDCKMIPYGDVDQFHHITEKTAAVIIEPVQAESGISKPGYMYLTELQDRCKDVGALLIFDEIQTGMGRTGSLFRLEEEQLEPDILLTAKAFGGGMPLGAFISSKEIFASLQDDPVLGHITTFGGHPVSCAAGLAALNVIIEESLLDNVEEKGALFEELLQHDLIQKTTRCGLWMALHFDGFETNQKIITACIKSGLITDWFLFAPQCLRIAPPLTISKEQIHDACRVIISVLNSF